MCPGQGSQVLAPAGTSAPLARALRMRGRSPCPSAGQQCPLPRGRASSARCQGARPAAPSRGVAVAVLLSCPACHSAAPAPAAPHARSRRRPGAPGSAILPTVKPRQNHHRTVTLITVFYSTKASCSRVRWTVQIAPFKGEAIWQQGPDFV